MFLYSWGRIYKSECEVKVINEFDFNKFLKNNKFFLPQGEMRSYGDVCLNTNGLVLKTLDLSSFLDFDPITGILNCESGVVLKEIQDTFLSRGWMLAVTPGTQLITVGGAIANDIHGKNHHKYGNFSHHILELKLLRSSGEVLTCSRQENSDFFYATIGGIGLTGIILSAKIKLLPIESLFLKVEHIPFIGIDNFINLNNLSKDNWDYTVAWIDCLSGKKFKGIFIRANHTNDVGINSMDKKKIKIPYNFSFSLINNFSLKLFNKLYYNAKKIKKESIQDLYNFLYPLDGILNWNLLYGKKGFYQYQCVFPFDTAAEAIEQMLDLIYLAQQGSFLVVLKAFGNIDSEGMLSFPMEGITLALDFPNLGEKTLNLLNKMDEIISKNNGRIYLAKDIRMGRDLFYKTYPNAIDFQKFRDPLISSDMALRLFEDIK